MVQSVGERWLFDLASRHRSQRKWSRPAIASVAWRMCAASEVATELVHIAAIASLASKPMSQRAAMREAPANPLRIAAIFSQKALGQAARAGEQNRCFGNRRSPLIDADTLDVAGYRIVATQRIRLQLQSRIPRTLAIFQSPLAIF